MPCKACAVNNTCIFHKSNLSSNTQLVDYLMTFHFERGQALFREGDRKKGIFFVKSGKIKYVMYDDLKNETIVAFANAGESLGHSIIYLDSDNHEYSAICVEDSIVCFLPFHIAKDELVNNYELLKIIAVSQYKSSISFIQTIMSYNTKNVRERVANSIQLLEQKFGSDSEGYIDISLTREEIANMSATTTESSIRYISEFQKDNIISVKDRKIKILDQARFSKLLSGKR